MNSPAIKAPTEESYVLLSAGRNEGRVIGRTIESVAAQSVLPQRWVIVDDGSTDDTVSVLQHWASRLPWLHYHTRPPGKKRSYGSQYAAVMEAYESVQDVPVGYIGKVDTDLEFTSPTYFAELLAEMERYPRLGITGGWLYEETRGRLLPRPSNSLSSVPGGIQFLRRQTFIDIAGYRPLRYGGSDWLAEISARMHGWDVRSVATLPVTHLRPTGGFDGFARSSWRWGRRDASFGTTLPFMIAKCARRIFSNPPVISSMIMFASYLQYRLAGGPLEIPVEQSQYLRGEQKRRLVPRFAASQR